MQFSTYALNDLQLGLGQIFVCKVSKSLNMCSLKVHNPGTTVFAANTSADCGCSPVLLPSVLNGTCVGHDME